MYGYPFPYPGFPPPPPSFQQYSTGYPQSFYPVPPFPQHPPSFPQPVQPPITQQATQPHQPQPTQQSAPASKDIEVAFEQDEAVAEEKKRRNQLAAVKKKMVDARAKMVVQRSTISTQVKPGTAKQEVQLFKLDSDEEEEAEVPRFNAKGRPMLQSRASEITSEPQASLAGSFLRRNILSYFLLTPAICL